MGNMDSRQQIMSRTKAFFIHFFSVYTFAIALYVFTYFSISKLARFFTIYFLDLPRFFYFYLSNILHGRPIYSHYYIFLFALKKLVTFGFSWPFFSFISSLPFLFGINEGGAIRRAPSGWRSAALEVGGVSAYTTKLLPHLLADFFVFSSF